MMDSHAHLERGVGNIYNDALSLQPRLPQYHPYVLRELIDSRKVPEVRVSQVFGVVMCQIIE